MTIDMSPMSVFLTIALFLVGIPGVILSIYVWLRITRHFFNEKDYEGEVLPDSQHGTAHFQGGSEQDATKPRSQAARPSDSVNERMIQSG